MLETLTNIDSLNAVELLAVHNELTANFDDMVESTYLPNLYEPLLKDISQADDHLDKAASAILTRLLAKQTIDNEKLHIRRGTFTILQTLQTENSDTSMSDIVTLRQIIKQRRALHTQIPTLIEEFEK
jgi:hypothetical protein